MGKFIDLSGQKYGMLKVLKRGEDYIAERCKQHKTRWICQCDCGKEVLIDAGKLRSGHTTSCGHNSSRATAGERFRTHGMSKTPVYLEYRAMRNRCLNPKDKFYSDYGGRGISICQRWLESFENFYADVKTLAHFGDKGYSLNRINNDGPYILTNVEYAEFKKQANNKRNNRLLTLNGEVHTLAEWSRITGINPGTLSSRIDDSGWSVERALTEPVKQNKESL